MYVIGLTGGIASGKSTISSTLKEKYNVPIIDADLIAYELSKPNGSIWKGYVDHYGKDIALLKNGELNRAHIAQVVFADPNEQKWMDKMAHPLIKARMSELIKQYEAEGEKVVVLDVPLLFESGWNKETDAVWVVYVNPTAQLERLIKRNNLTKEDAEKRIASQMSLEEKKRMANVVLDNSGDLKETLKQLEIAWKNVLDEEK